MLSADSSRRTRSSPSPCQTAGGACRIAVHLEVLVTSIASRECGASQGSRINKMLAQRPLGLRRQGAFEPLCRPGSRPCGNPTAQRADAPAWAHAPRPRISDFLLSRLARSFLTGQGRLGLRLFRFSFRLPLPGASCFFSLAFLGLLTCSLCPYRLPLARRAFLVDRRLRGRFHLFQVSAGHRPGRMCWSSSATHAVVRVLQGS